MSGASIELAVLRVFVDPEGGHGNHLGVFLDGQAIAPGLRQSIAAQLGYAETVFVDDVTLGTCRIHTPEVELPLAGHPLVGTAWLLAQRGLEVRTLRPPAGEVATWTEGELVYLRADPESAPAFELLELADSEAVEAYPVPDDPGALVNVWAWADRAAGRVRARVFAGGVGVPEDEATGAAALRFAAHIGRPVSIVQGRGSQIMARPGPGNTAEVGGRCVLDEVREVEVAGL